jgi:hypothetical protein
VEFSHQLYPGSQVQGFQYMNYVVLYRAETYSESGRDFFINLTVDQHGKYFNLAPGKMSFGLLPVRLDSGMGLGDNFDRDDDGDFTVLTLHPSFIRHFQPRKAFLRPKQ